MKNLRVALNSFIESLVYMVTALLTVFSADFMQDYIGWQMALGFCLLICVIMAVIKYGDKVYGYGFDEDNEDISYWMSKPTPPEDELC